MLHGHLVESAHGSEAVGGLGGATEELQHRDGWSQLLRGGRAQVDDGMGRLVYHHLTLVTQARLDEVVHGTFAPVSAMQTGLLKFGESSEKHK